MATKAHLDRLRRIKAATETVEAELNRLPPDEEMMIPGYLRDAMHVVIRHLKARWAELNAEGGE